MCTRLGLAVPCFVQPLISCSFLLLRPCRFQSPSPWPLCEHHWLVAGALQTLRVWLLRHSDLCRSFKAFVTLDVNYQKPGIFHRPINAGQTVDPLVVIVVCSISPTLLTWSATAVLRSDCCSACTIKPVSLLNLLFKLAELGVRASLASVSKLIFLKAPPLRTHAWQSVSASRPALSASAVTSPPQTVDSDDWCKLLRSCCTLRPFSTIAVCATSHRSRALRADTPTFTSCWRFLWVRRPSEVRG